MTDKIVKSEDRFGQTLLRVALPIALQSLISTSLNLVDNLMVGSLGETELAAVGLSVQIFFVHWMVLFGFTSGTATYMAQFWGKRDLHNIRRTVGIALMVNFAVSLCFFFPSILFPDKVLSIFTNIPEVIEIGRDYIRIGAVCFLTVALVVPFTTVLRATQQTKIPLIISIIVFGTNTFLNYVLIFGNFGAPKMGVIGAVTATVIARSLELILTLFVVFGRKNIVAGKVKEYFSWHRDLLNRVVRNAVPTTMNETLWGLGNAMYNAAYGRIGVTAFAAIQASGTINNLFIMACFSIGDAALILLGEKLGKGDEQGAVLLARRLVKTCLGVGVVAGAGLFVASRFIVRLFDFSPEGTQYTLTILTIYSVLLVLKIFNGLMVTGVLRAGGDTTFAAVSEVACVWFIGVPMAFIGALWLELPVYYVVMLVSTEEIVKAGILWRRYKTNKWVKNLVHNIEK